MNPGLINFHSKTKFDNIWTGNYNSFAKDHYSGEIFSFGLNNYKQLGELCLYIFSSTYFTNISRKYFLSGLSELEVYTWPVITPTFSLDRNWKSICGGQHHTLALDIAGECHEHTFNFIQLDSISKVFIFRNCTQVKLMFLVEKSMDDLVLVKTAMTLQNLL